MGAGKTTIGQALATSLNTEWLDLDEVLTSKYQKTPSEIITNNSLETFRNYEKETFFSLLDRQNCIISLGGGTVTIPEVKDYLQKNKFVFYLNAPTKILHNRILNDTKNIRPLANKSLSEFEKLFIKRHLDYESTATYIINANQDISLVVKNIIALL